VELPLSLFAAYWYIFAGSGVLLKYAKAKAEEEEEEGYKS
jgi:hypothetical protein